MAELETDGLKRPCDRVSDETHNPKLTLPRGMDARLPPQGRFERQGRSPDGPNTSQSTVCLSNNSRSWQGRIADNIDLLPLAVFGGMAILGYPAAGALIAVTVGIPAYYAKHRARPGRNRRPLQGFTRRNTG